MDVLYQLQPNYLIFFFNNELVHIYLQPSYLIKKRIGNEVIRFGEKGNKVVETLRATSLLFSIICM